MKIQGTDPGTSIAALQKAAEARSAEQAQPQEASEAGLQSRGGLEASSAVQLSQRAQDVQQGTELAKAEPEIRADVVEQARADLEAGRMQADPAALADLIARDLF